MDLEIGSGSLNSHSHLTKKDLIHIDILKDAHHIENICDAHKLPFKDKSFNTVYCFHVLEHCFNPSKVIKELIRVTKNRVILAIPNYDYYKNIGECDQHIYSWNENTFEFFLKQFFDIVKVQTRFKIRESGSRPVKVLKYVFFSYLKMVFRCNNDLIATCIISR